MGGYECSPIRLTTLAGVRMLVLAHQGGWDEALYIVGTLVLLALLVRLANKRADQYRAQQGEPAPASAQASAGPDAVDPAPTARANDQAEPPLEG
jgi:predicted lipid-binding transport protein (Tim44 family)